MRPKRITQVLLYVAAIAVAIFMLAPFVWLLLASIHTQADLVTLPLRWWPSPVYLQRYLLLFTDQTNTNAVEFRAALGNSLIVASVVVVISMIVGIFGAYAFSRMRFKGRRGILMAFLFTYILPQIALVVPLFATLNSLNLLNKKTGLIIVDCSLVVPFVLWILSNFFLTIPPELEESAWIDGASRVGALFRIVLPSAGPGIFAAGMFAFLLAWDEFMYALSFAHTNVAKTLPVAIAEFSAQHSTDFGLVAAGGVIAALPPVILAIIFQRYVVSGLVSGAVK